MKESIPIRAMVFIAVTATAGAAALGISCLHWRCDDPLKFCCYLLIAILASTMKVSLPGIESTMSVTFLFILLGVLELSLPEVLILGCAAALVQSLWKAKKRPQLVQVVFNILSVTAVGVWLTYLGYHYAVVLFRGSLTLSVLTAGGIYFLTNTVPVSAILALVSKSSMIKIWKETYFWGLPYNLAGAAVVGAMHFSNRFVGWQNSLL